MLRGDLNGGRSNAVVICCDEILQARSFGENAGSLDGKKTRMGANGFVLFGQINHFPKLLAESTLLEKDGVVQKIDGQSLRQRREQWQRGWVSCVFN